jgi:hypothetical protein
VNAWVREAALKTMGYSGAASIFERGTAVARLIFR